MGYVRIAHYPGIIDDNGETKPALGSMTICKHCRRATGDHWRENNKCAVKDCQCPGYESPEEEIAETRKRIASFLWAITVAVLTSPLFFLFDSFGKPGNGRAAWFSAMTILIAMNVRWELRKHIWFWLTMLCIVVEHVPLVLFVPWTSRWIPAVGILPIVVVDIALIFGCLYLVEKWKSPNHLEAANQRAH
jgi:hypothetical protein